MNRSRRLFLTGLTAMASTPLLSYCHFDESALVVASHSWTGYELLFLARHEGWLNNQHVQLLETGSASDSIAALADGKADAACLTLDEVLRARAQGLNLTCVLVFDVSAGADVVLARANIDELTDLAGKRIGFEKSALGYLMFYKLLQAANLAKTAVIQVPLTYDKHLAAWNSNLIDALITFEPVSSQVMNQGGQRLFDSRQLPDTIFDVLAVKSQAIVNYAQNLEHLVTQYFYARNYFYQNPQDAAYKMAVRMNLSATDVFDSFRGLNIPNPQLNQKYLAYPQGNLIEVAKTLSTLMVEAGILVQTDDLTGLVDASFLPQRT